MKTIPLERLAKELAQSIHRAWELSLAGHKAAHDSFEQMKAVSVGDMVVETSTFYNVATDGKWRGQGSVLDTVGILDEVAQEKVEIAEWDEEADGPWPTETVYYILTLDGRRYRWVNANFVRAPRYRPPEPHIRDLPPRTYESYR